MQRSLSVTLPEISYMQLEELALESRTRVEEELVEAVNVYIAYRKNFIDAHFSFIGKSAKPDTGNIYEPNDDPLIKYIGGIAHGGTASNIDQELYGV